MRASEKEGEMKDVPLRVQMTGHDDGPREEDSAALVYEPLRGSNPVAADRRPILSRASLERTFRPELSKKVSFERA